MSLLNIYYAGLGLLSGVFLTLWYLHYFSKFNLIRKGTYYLKKDVIIDGKLFALQKDDEVTYGN